MANGKEVAQMGNMDTSATQKQLPGCMHFILQFPMKQVPDPPKMGCNLSFKKSCCNTQHICVLFSVFNPHFIMSISSLEYATSLKILILLYNQQLKHVSRPGFLKLWVTTPCWELATLTHPCVWSDSNGILLGAIEDHTKLPEAARKSLPGS